MTCNDNKAIVVSIFLVAMVAFSSPMRGAAAAPQSSGGFWKLVNVATQDHRTDSSETVACISDGACESTQTGGNGSLIYKVSHSWSKPPETVAPNETIPVSFEMRNLQITNYRGGRASLDARLAGQGWAFSENPFVIGTEQPVGTVIKRTDTKHRSLPAGRSGDKMVYEVHVKGGMVRQYNYIYEWTE